MALLIRHLYMRPEMNSNPFEISLWSKISLWCKGFFAGAVLMDLSKAFDCIPHDLLIAKLNTYVFDRKSLVFFYSYLKQRKQCVNMKNMQSTFQTHFKHISNTFQTHFKHCYLGFLKDQSLDHCYLTYLLMILLVL